MRPNGDRVVWLGHLTKAGIYKAFQEALHKLTAEYWKEQEILAYYEKQLK